MFFDGLENEEVDPDKEYDLDDIPHEVLSPKEAAEAAMDMFNQAYDVRDHVKMLLWMAGHTDSHAVPHADLDALQDLVIDIFMSPQYHKLLRYLRS